MNVLTAKVTNAATQLDKIFEKQKTTVAAVVKAQAWVDSAGKSVN
jgi:enamine deaminase RidA (YjgF/YER057c/UK114 family)